MFNNNMLHTCHYSFGVNAAFCLIFMRSKHAPKLVVSGQEDRIVHCQLETEKEMRNSLLHTHLPPLGQIYILGMNNIISTDLSSRYLWDNHFYTDFRIRYFSFGNHVISDYSSPGFLTLGFEKWSDEIGGGVIERGSCLIAEGWVDFRFRLKLPQLSPHTHFSSLRWWYEYP